MTWCSAAEWCRRSPPRRPIAEAGRGRELPPAVADDSPLRDPLLELEQEFQDQQEEGKL